MNIIPYEYGKYEAIEVDSLIDFLSEEDKDGNFPNKNDDIDFSPVPIIGWLIDDEGYSSPILIDGFRIKNPAIIDVERRAWWFDCESGKNIKELKDMIRKYANSIIESKGDL